MEKAIKEDIKKGNIKKADAEMTDEIKKDAEKDEHNKEDNKEDSKEVKSSIKSFIVFVLKLSLVVGATFCVYWLLFWFLWLSDICPNAYDNAYQHALLLQYNALENPNRENEVIVFGASYVPFGIDTETLKEETGYEVQTLGVEADMGTRELMDILRKTAKKGDVLCYMFGMSNSYYEEYTSISCAFESDKDKLREYFANRESAQQYYRDTMIWRKLYSLTVGNMVENIRSKLSTKEQIYSLSSFDDKGNMNILREGTIIDISEVPDEYLDFEDSEIVDIDLMREINSFAKWCKENEITFVISYGMLVDEAVKSSDEEIKKFHKDASEFLDADILLEPDDYFMSFDNFYNHQYHLNTEGARKYSHILGSAIREYLEK